MRRALLVLLATLGLLAAPVVVVAAPAAPFGQPCHPQDGVRFCPAGTQRTPTFDGVPLDADVTLPAHGAGPFPTIVLLHGYGGSKTDYESHDPAGDGSVTYHYNNVYYARHGYAVLNYTARGFGESCGSPASRAASPVACAKGYIRLADQRYEARDTQFLLGRLVDQGYAAPGALGVTGISYGGGQSMQLAFLSDRVRRPDGSFAPWRSPDGTPLAIGAAWPRWPWSDLVSSLIPNGRFDTARPGSAFASRDPSGIEKQSYVTALFGAGRAAGYYAPPGTDPDADLTTWFAVISKGEPYGRRARAIADEIYRHHSAISLTAHGRVSPLLIQNGWTDDLFPPKEALRPYVAYPAQPISLQFGDLGHSRGSNKPAVNRYFNDKGFAFLAAGLSGNPPAPRGVDAFAMSCPKTAPETAAPYRAASWRKLATGARTRTFGGTQTVSSLGGNPATGAAFDPIANSDACKQVPAERAPGTAVYRLPVRGNGFTMLGLPTVRATVHATGPFGELNSRLWDVAPDGTQRLISRGAYRLRPDQSGQLRMQLHGNGWRFEPGHTVKLELVGADAPYLRAANAPFTVDVSNLTLRLPVRNS